MVTLSTYCSCCRSTGLVPEGPPGFRDYTHGVIRLPNGGNLCAQCVRLGVSLFAELWRSRVKNETPDPTDPPTTVVSVSFENPNWRGRDSESS